MNPSQNLMSYHHLRQERLAYPLQLEESKRELNRLIASHTLPFEAFQTILPHLGEVAKSVNHVLYELFRQFAENPKEIGMRAYRYNFLGSHQNRKIFPFETTKCDFIYAGLITSLFNVRRDNNIQLQPLINFNKLSFKNVFETIEKNAQLLLETPTLNFFVYSFKFFAHKNYGGHVFLVTQSLNEQGKEEYGIFQSYLKKYCLQKFLKNNDYILNRDEFAVFFKELQACVLSETWTNSTEAFYSKYFKVANSETIGSPNPCNKPIEIKFGMRQFKDILVQQEMLKIFVNDEACPKFEPEPCKCCHVKIPRIIDEAAKQRIEQLNKKFYDLYDRIEPISGPIQVDFESLGLDLNETGSIDLPKRDENGNIMLNRHMEAKWSSQPITLRKVVHHVIEELNKSIQNTREKDVILFNHNKVPIQDYTRLGLPQDRIFAEEGDKLWIDRIIAALIQKGHLTKLLGVNGHGYIIQINENQIP